MKKVYSKKPNNWEFLTNRWRRSREAQAWHLYRPGWTQEEIAEKLGLSSHASISEIVGKRQMSDFDKLLGPPDLDEASQDGFQGPYFGSRRVFIPTFYAVRYIAEPSLGRAWR